MTFNEPQLLSYENAIILIALFITHLRFTMDPPPTVYDCTPEMASRVAPCQSLPSPQNRVK
jgi:hypothetical protein